MQQNLYPDENKSSFFINIKSLLDKEMECPLAPTGTKCRALWMAGKWIIDMPEGVAIK